MLKWRLAQYLELRWWKNYLRGKNKAEYLQWKQSYWQQLLQKVGEGLLIEPGKTVCDMGCGPAGIFIALPEHQVTAVDPLIGKYEKHTSFFKKSDYPNVGFVESTIEDFESTEKFDVVFCMNAINHVHDMENAFKKLKEVCAEGGTLVVSVDAHNYSFFKHLFRWVPGDMLHPQQYDLDEYKQFLEKQGFKILKTELLKMEWVFGHWVVVAEK